jgi:hypothetical protein
MVPAQASGCSPHCPGWHITGVQQVWATQVPLQQSVPLSQAPPSATQSSAGMQQW